MSDRTSKGRRQRRAVGWAVAALLVLTGCGGSEQPRAQRSPQPSAAASPASSPPASVAPLAWSDCGDGFSCAELTVPLDEDDPGAGTVDLALTRRPATGPGTRLGSLVVNPGGPGASAVQFLQDAWTLVPEPVRARFDLVAFDPRGVGASSPVRCATTAELDRYFALDPSPEDDAELAALAEGTAALADGCEERSGRVLPYLSTEVAAADLDRVRTAVGDERLTYLGYSYGTSIGAAYLERFPENVRAMVLDGALDPSLTWDEILTGQALGFESAFEVFLADCEQAPCAYRSEVDGPLGAAFDRLAERIDREPLPAGDGRTLGPGELTLGVGAALYSPSAWPVLGEALVAAERGDGAPLLALSDSYLQRGPDGYANISEANLAVNCLDRPWPREREPYVELAEQVADDAPRFGPAIALSGLGCAAWPVPPVDEPQPVRGEGAPPVVVIGTTGDPATPYAWSVGLAEQLSSAVLLTFEGEGHTVYRTGAPACLREPVDTYLLTGDAPQPTTC